jgi:N-acetylneuraminic acid mutarotase
MAFASTALLLFSLPGLAQQSRQVLHNHVRPAVSSGQAAVVGPLPATQQLRVSIVLPLRNQADLTALLGRLYDPSSPDYRHFLSVEQFTEQFGPTADDYQAVVDFAQANGLTVTDRAENRMIVAVTGRVAQVEKAFNVSMEVYRHPTENRTFFSPDREPSLHLSVPVAHISGLNNFSIPRPMLKQRAAGQAIANITGSGPGGSYLASDMRAAYYGGNALTGSGQSVGLFELDGYNLSDVNLTFSSVGQSPNVPINNVLLDGATGANLSGDDTEEVLDIVQAIGMAPGLTQVRVYLANIYSYGFDDASIFNKMAVENTCKQLSVSWGWEPDDPATDDVFFQEFAAQGQSVFVASGDKGAFDVGVSPIFYPTEDPWVTAVGGTSLITSGAAGSWVSETAWNTPAISAGSGGGFSPDAIQIQGWQAAVANAANGGSTTARNVPDVAAEADVDNYSCSTISGLGSVCREGVGGTSFAAPRWAGFMALVNQQVVTAGTAPAGGLGFMNPTIYSIGTSSSYNSDFHDIVSGNNDCCNQSAWFSAVTGYDLVTGWGSPNGQNLINALAPLLPGPGFTLSASPSSLTINPGASGTTAITVTGRNGFTGNVTLAASNLPSGVTASFGTNPTSGTSVLTLTASSSVVAHPYYNVGITGTSGSLTSTVFLPLTVSGIALSTPGSLILAQNYSNTIAITVTDVGGFSGNVSLAVSGLPSGVTPLFGTDPTTGSPNLTLTASGAAALGTVTVSVTGSSAGVPSAIAEFALTVTPPPGFTLTATPSSLTIAQGASGASTITLTPMAGFTSSATLAVSGLPSGVTASFTANPATGSSGLTLTASHAAALGMATVTVTGSSPIAPSATTTLALAVTAFALSASPGGLIVAQGTSGASTVTVNEGGAFTGSVMLSASGLPSGVTASFGTNPAAGSSTLTLTASSTAALGLATVTITGTPVGLPPETTALVLLVTANMSAKNEWTWMGGSTTVPVSVVGGNPGVDGTLGVPAAGNIPGSRMNANSWTDSNGNFWLFGGNGVDAADTQGLLNDLWEFNPSTNEWAWMSGSSTVPNVPGQFGGNPGIYGTLGLAAAGNTPGSREGAASWTDNGGHLWLLGGYGYDANGNQNYLNDLWEFDLSTNEWAWMGGSSTVPQSGTGDGYPGVYGTHGVPAPANIPGGRLQASAWTGSDGRFWLFGGRGYDANRNLCWLNDLWVFNPSTKEWAWMGGGSTVPGLWENPGVYGTLGVPAAANTPGGRLTASTWTDSSGRLWLFGGLFEDASGNWTVLNDLWEFSPSTNEWAWMGGSSSVPSASGGYAGNPGVYGILGLPAAGNAPGGHEGASAWTDNGGHLWLFGGYGYDANGVSGFLNDLWEFDPPANKWTWMGGSSTVPSPFGGSYGTYGALGVPAAGNIPGSHSYASSWTDGSGNLWLFGGNGYAASGVGYLNDLWEFQPSAPVTPGVSLSASPGSLIVAQGASATSTVTVTGSGGFTGSVMLSASGLPSGVTASFSPNPTTGTSVATLTVSSTAAPGSYSPAITGTSGTLTATVGLALTIAPGSVSTATTLSSSPNPSTFGQSMMLTATVSPSTATGTVQFLDSTTPLGTLTLAGGSAVLTLSTLTVGAHSITAVYNGDANDAASTSAILTQTINRAASRVSLTSSLNPSAFGQTLALTATLSPSSATGTVQFLNGSTALGTVTISGGAAALSISTLSVGAHSLTAVYSGDANDAASTSATLTQTVNKVASSVLLASSRNPSDYGQSVTFSATVTPSAAIGSVQFLNGSTVLGTVTISGGRATLSSASLAAGAHSITAVYSGDTYYATSTSAVLTQAVNKATSTVALASSKNPAASGQSVTFTAAVLPSSATGTVHFRDGSTALGTVSISAGSAALSISTLSVGTHSVNAVYSGDGNYLASTSAVLAQSVTGAACHVTYAVTTQWNVGFGTAITIENTGTTSVHGWNLTWTWPGNQRITEAWDSTYSQTGVNARLTNESYNAAIAPGAALTGIGFNASYSGTNTAPTAFSLNGTLCK